MGFLDFLTKPRISATPRDPLSVTPYEQPQVEPIAESGGLLAGVPQTIGMGDPQPLRRGAPQELQQMPEIKHGPSLLSGVMDYATSPQFLAALGAGVKGMGGDSSGVEMAWRIGERDRAVQSQAEQKAEAKAEKARAKAEAQADLARRNAAFRAAYGPKGFDPQAYMAAMGDGGDVSEAFSLAKDLAPTGGVSGDVSFTRDPLTGEVTWGESRPWTERDQEAADRNDIMSAVALGRLDIAQGQAELQRRREARLAAGGGRGGGNGAPPPPGPGYTVQVVGP